MINESMLYWITRLDYLQQMCSAFAVIFGVVGAIFLIGVIGAWIGMETESATSGCEETVARILPFCKAARKGLFICGGIFMLSMVGTVFVPSTAEMAMIKVIPPIANSDFVQKELPEEARDLYRYAKAYLKEKLGSVKEPKNEAEVASEAETR